MVVPKRFIMPTDSSGVCSFCNGDPLPYPPILIPTKPRYEKIPDSELGKWKWDYRPACLKCAKRMLKRMKPRHIDPMEK